MRKLRNENRKARHWFTQTRNSAETLGATTSFPPIASFGEQSLKDMNSRREWRACLPGEDGEHDPPPPRNHPATKKAGQPAVSSCQTTRVRTDAKKKMPRVGLLDADLFTGEFLKCMGALANCAIPFHYPLATNNNCAILHVGWFRLWHCALLLI